MYKISDGITIKKGPCSNLQRPHIYTKEPGRMICRALKGGGKVITGPCPVPAATAADPMNGDPTRSPLAPDGAPVAA